LGIKAGFSLWKREGTKEAKLTGVKMDVSDLRRTSTKVRLTQFPAEGPREFDREIEPLESFYVRGDESEEREM
jgi:hypothetical protein